MRMAEWVQDIFPALRATLNEPHNSASTASLATAIMLASLEVVSPGAFGSSIPWQQHLGLARDMMTQQLADSSKNGTVVGDDRGFAFLWSWLAYLDIIASLSMGPHSAAPSLGWLQESVIDMDLDQLSCIMGFTKRAAYLLSQVAELARRSDFSRVGPDGQVWPDWVAGSDTTEQARALEQSLLESIEQPLKPCRHLQNSIIHELDLAEMEATNRAFHWAGLVHLHRRVLGKPSGHVDVQGPVQEVLNCMQHIRTGGTGETGFLFPMFIAGCETAADSQKTMVLARFESLESSGMMQVRQGADEFVQHEHR